MRMALRNISEVYASMSMKELEIWRLPTKLTEKPEKSVLFYEEKEGGKEMVVADTFAYSGLVPGCAML